ncbi:MAG TPA: diguanylate cyclase, partial [Rhodanobacteraceae bacterium]|nr:diguanylate cyclase [Rhodanobacteraceae bacterium]
GALKVRCWAGHSGKSDACNKPQWPRWLLLFGWLLASASALASEPLPLFGPRLPNTPVTTYERSGDEAAPASYSSLTRWLNHHAKRDSVSMFGGNYWLLTRFRHNQPDSRWSVSFANTWFRQARVVILGDDGSRQAFELGQQLGGTLLDYHGVPARLEPGHEYAILVAIKTPFFTSLPRIDVETRTHHRQRHANETVLTLATLGLLCGLGLFILFIGLWIRDRSYQLYGAQALVLVCGWGAYFGLPAGWLNLESGWFNFTFWFIALPIVHAPFTIRFLALERNAPWLARVGYAIVAAAALAAPASWLAPSLAFFIATLMVTVVVTYSTVAGIWALRHGIRQARFFTLSYLGVLLPGVLILPANFGLIPDLIDNSDLLTLLGNGCEGMLLAFALADNVKLLTDARERFRRGMQEAVTQASIDALTGLGNRLAFNVLIEEITTRPADAPLRGAAQIAMIDLDGLKQINDTLGHARGDDLLRTVGAGLSHLNSDKSRAFRLGGDEFAVVAFGDDLSLQRLSKSLSELDRGLRVDGFAQAGISFGLSSAPATRRRLNSAEVAELVRQADRAMYTQKTRRRQARSGGTPLT